MICSARSGFSRGIACLPLVAAFSLPKWSRLRDAGHVWAAGVSGVPRCGIAAARVGQDDGQDCKAVQPEEDRAVGVMQGSNSCTAARHQWPRPVQNRP